MKTILLTGASGFIGSHIRKTLLRENRFKIISIVRDSSALIPTEDEIVLQGNFYDASFLKTIQQPIDVIIHCAAIRGEQNTPESEYHKVNVTGTEALLKFAKERAIPRFIYISSVGVLGTIPPSQPAVADQSPQPDGTYHRSKCLAEELVRNSHSVTLQTLILRPTITYGVGDNGFVPRLMQLVKSKRFVFPKNAVKIHLLNVEALSHLILKLLENKHYTGESYLVADMHPLSLKSVVDFFSLELNQKTYPAYLQIPDIIFTVAKWVIGKIGKKPLLISLRLISESWTYDISKTMRDLDYQPAETMESLKSLVRNHNGNE